MLLYSNSTQCFIWLCNCHTSIAYSTVVRSIAGICIQPEVNIPPRSYIETTDRPTVLYAPYSTVSVQQTNLLPENASQNDTIFLWCISSYGCAITVLYMVCMFAYQPLPLPFRGKQVTPCSRQRSREGRKGRRSPPPHPRRVLMMMHC